MVLDFQTTICLKEVRSRILWKKSVNFYQTTRRHIPEDGGVHSDGQVNLSVAS